VKAVRSRRIALGTLILGVVMALFFSSWLVAQARAFCALSITLDAPVLARAVELLTSEPRTEDRLVAGVPTLIVRPAGEGPWPTIVFGNGATREGRGHPVVQRLARGHARAGFMVLVPDLPGLRSAEVDPEAAATTVAVARAAAESSDTRDGRVAFIGVSTGAALGLVAAKDPLLVDRVSVVAGIAPYTDITNVLRLGTTASYRVRGEVRRFTPDPYLSLVTARSLIRALPAGRDRDALLGTLEPFDEDDRDPLGRVLAGRPERLGPRAEEVLALLANRDPARFDELYAALPTEVRLRMERLSPVGVRGEIRAPIELATGPRDKFFPLSELEAPGLGPRRRVTVTTALDHGDASPRLSELPDLLRLDAFVVRTLRSAALRGG
jgi:pimeloyl-ACP methyl ester carboxylesterase